MENRIYLDTHVICWLYSGQVEFLSEKAKNEIENNEILISPIIKLELQYLLEINRISALPNEILTALQREIYLKICDLDFLTIVNKSMNISWTRDPFDRIITANASINNSTLITKDSTILSNYSNAVWG